MKKLPLFLSLIFALNIANSQTVTDLPWDPRDCTSLVNNCNANDLEPLGAYLAIDVNGTPFAGCEFGTVTDIYVCAQIVNSTNSNRPNISFAVDLNIGGVFTGFVGQCVETVLGGGDTLTICAGPYSWECGESIALDNLLLTWNSAGNNPEPCPEPTDPVCFPYFSGPKCRFLGTDSLTAFQATFDETLICPVGTNNYSVDFNSNVDGGKSPFTYSWDFGSGASPMTSSIENPTGVTYSTSGMKTVTLTVIDADNRSYVSTKMIQINQGMTVNINNQVNDTICDNSSFLTANITDGYPPYQFLWSNGLGNAMTVSAPASSGTFTVTVTDSIGCTATANIILEYQAVVASAGVDQDLCNCPGVEESCPNSDSLTLIATGGTIYSWSSGQSTASINVKPATTTQYIVTVSNSFGCEDMDTVIVSVNDSPEASISGLTSVCNGSSIVLTGSGSGTFLWSTGQTTPTITVSPSTMTTYTLTVTSGNGCFNIATHDVDVDELSISCEVYPPSLTSNECQTTVCVGDSINFKSNPSYGTGSYGWTGPGFSATGMEISINSVLKSNEGNYTLTYTAPSGCMVSEIFELNVIEVPDIIITENQTICVDGIPQTLQVSD